MSQPSRPTIIAINLTALDVVLTDLGPTVPGSGQVELNKYAYLYEIHGSKSLYDAIQNDQILISDGVTTYTKAQSLNATTSVASPVNLQQGIDSDTHETLSQLIHLAEEGGPFKGYSGAEKVTTGGLFPTSVCWYQDSTHTGKIIEKTIDRSDPVFPPQVQWKAYAADGVTVTETATDAITYTNAAETLRVRTAS